MDGACSISKGRKIISKGICSKGLYLLSTTAVNYDQLSSYALASDHQVDHQVDIQRWHERLVHVHIEGIRTMVKNGTVRGIEIYPTQKVGICESCIYGKSCRSVIPKSRETRSKAVLDLAHSDMHGSLQKSSKGGGLYHITVIDDFSRHGTVYIMK